LIKQLIKPTLDRGEIVLLDRYYDSTTAYQGYGRGINLDIIRTINQIASLGIIPDLTIYLDILPEDAMIRKFSEKSLPLSFGKNETPLDRMESSGLEFYHRVRNGYKEMVQAEPNRFIEISALLGVEEIHKKIISQVLNRLHKHNA